MIDFLLDDIPGTIKRHINEPVCRNNPAFLQLFYTYYKKEEDINVIFLMYLKSIGKYHYFVYACLARYFLRIGERDKAYFVLQEGIMNDCVGKEELTSIKNMVGYVNTNTDILPESVYVFGGEWIEIAVNYVTVDLAYGALELKARDYWERLSHTSAHAPEEGGKSCEHEDWHGKSPRKRRKSIVEMVCDEVEDDRRNERSIIEESLEDERREEIESYGPVRDTAVVHCTVRANEKETENAHGTNLECLPSTTSVKLFGEEYFCTPAEQNIRSVCDVVMAVHSRFSLGNATYIVKEIDGDLVKITSIENYSEEHTFTSREYVLRKVDKVVNLESIRTIIPHETGYIKINRQLYTKCVRPFLYTLKENEKWANSNICVYFVGEVIKILRWICTSGLCVELSLRDFDVVDDDEKLSLKLNNLNFGERMRFDELELMIVKAGIAMSESLCEIEENASKRMRQMNLADEIMEHKLRLLSGISFE